ncbi:MAG: hypothetical protein M3Z29_04605 [Pseudomonadota bacterium]|nr:hypothetical protein [Pseudomonadota bacterium]
MMKSGIDQDALVAMFAGAGAKQGEAVRKAVAGATLKALQGRELTLDGIRKVVKTVAGAATLGAAKNPGSEVDVEAILGKALAGIDSALLQAVEANRKALEQFMGQGIALGEKPMQNALANIEKMEDVFFDAIAKAGKAAGPMQAPWEQALAAMKMKGSETGSQATQTVDSLMAQAQTSLRQTRATGLRAAQAMLDNYAALVSGVLIGMSEGLQAGTGPSPSASAASAEPSRGGAAAKSPARKRAKTSA